MENGNDEVVNGNDGVVIEIQKIMKRVEFGINNPGNPPHICKVPPRIRNWNEEAYTPQVISIGPIHHKNDRLMNMEQHKERYLRSFIERGHTEERHLVHAIREMECRIRGCYGQTVDNITSDELVKMMLVDACFILELLYRCGRKGSKSHVPMLLELSSKSMKLDLILLENQLPFFVIKELHNLVFPFTGPNRLLELTFKFFDYFNIHSMRALPGTEIVHFTDLIRTFQLPPNERLPPRKSSYYSQIGNFYSATQLYQAGVRFEFRKSKRLDFVFKRGVLKIPRLEFYDWTEAVIRNVMALEESGYIENAYFTDYYFFMDSLIRTGKDVDLLCDKNILVNNLGGSIALESMVKSLSMGIFRTGMRVDYIERRNELERFYVTPSWCKWMEMLRREFFGTPSAAAWTVLGLGVVTVLTLIQTVCSIIQATDSGGKAV